MTSTGTRTAAPTLVCASGQMQRIAEDGFKAVNVPSIANLGGKVQCDRSNISAEVHKDVTRRTPAPRSRRQKEAPDLP